jgi:AcrR family transcriptional regulator
MARTKPAEERRADLLEAGKELFLAKGVAGTSLDDITSRAGVSKGLFYLYFRSKDDLLAALHDQFSTMLADRIRAAAGSAADWPAKLDACVKAIFDSYHERDDLHEVLFRQGAPVSDSHQATHALVRDAISDVFAGGKAAGAFDVEDPEATAALCWASTHSFDPGFHREAGPADARLARAAQQLFRRAAGIRLPPGRGLFTLLSVTVGHAWYGRYMFRFRCAE